MNKTELINKLKSAKLGKRVKKSLPEIHVEKLKALDAVAYVRFASVHREFKDVETFMRELESLKKG